MALSPTQVQQIINAKTAIENNANPALQAGLVLTYYAALENAGFWYGGAAAEVVTDTGMGGITANRYALNKLNGDLGLDYVAHIPEIQYGLVMADFEARAVKDPTTGEIIDLDDINGDDISQYHDAVFENVYGTAAAQQAWTAYHIVRALNSEVWVGLDDIVDYVTDVYLPMVKGVIFEDSTSSTYANFYEWTQDMRTGFVLDKRDWSWTAGDGVNNQALRARVGLGVPDQRV